MSKIITPILFFLLFWISTSNAQVCATPGVDGSANISGQVNTYYPAAPNITLNAGITSVTLASVPASVTFGGGAACQKACTGPSCVNSYSANNRSIKVGDLLLIIQMQDATINSTNSNLYGANLSTSGPDNLGGTGYTSLGNAGLFEYVVATNDVPLSGGVLTFRGFGNNNGVVNTYYNIDYSPSDLTRGKRTFQVVLVPQYSNIKLVSTIYAPPFNGNAGGIIAFDVAGRVNFNGQTIDASGRGFRGGFVNSHNSIASDDASTYVTTSTTTTYSTSGKGEGIVGTGAAVWDGFVQATSASEGLPNGSFGMGAPGNAGGGGNSHNAGGGGGGNGGYGGVGGKGWISSGLAGGRPGFITYQTGAISVARLIMGGGGGAGEVNDAACGADGGPGGGIILLNVGSITGSGSIISNGADAQSISPLPDGGGGGGAGGTIFLRMSNLSSIASLTITAQGGKGADAYTNQTGNTNVTGNSQCTGSGGGGGGGIIMYVASSSTINASVPGGTAGIYYRSSNSSGSWVFTDNQPGVKHGEQPGTVGSITSTLASLPSYLQGGGSICYPELTSVLTEANAGAVGTRLAGAGVTYTLTISNKAGVGNAGGVIADISLPVGITYQSVTVTYSGGSGGDSSASITTNQGTLSTPRFGNFVVAPGGSVVLTLLARVDCAAASQTYNASAQVYYFDPTRDVNPLQRICPSPSVFAFPGSLSVSTSYESGGSVPGKNYNGSVSSTEDVVVNSSTPTLSSSLSLAAIQSGSIFSYTPTSSFTFPSGGGVLSYTWSRSSVAGISNGAATGTNTISEALINTTTSTISVPYLYTLSINGCARNSQTVTVVVNPSVLTISGSPNPVNGGSSSTVSVSLPGSITAATTITLTLIKTGTAVADTHYVSSSVPSSVIIPMGQNGVTFTLQALNAGVIGLSTTLGLSGTLTNYTINGSTVTIVDITGNNPSNTIINIGTGTISESLSKTLVVGLTGTVKTYGPLTVTIVSDKIFPRNYTANDGRGAQSISGSTNFTVVIPANQNSVSVTILTFSDGNVGNNVFNLSGSVSATGFTINGGVLTVIDTDSGGVNGTGSTTLTISSGTVSETLSRVLNVSLPSTINVTTTPLTLTLVSNVAFPQNYTSNDGRGVQSISGSTSFTVVIPSNQHSVSFTIQTASDGNVGNNIFTLSGSPLSNYVFVSGTLTVVDTDGGGVNGTGSTTLTISSGTVSETLSTVLNISLPSTINVTNTPLTLTLVSNVVFPRNYTSNDGRGAQSISGSTSFTVVIPSNQHSVSFTIQTASDGNVGNNIFVLSGSPLSNYVFVSGTLTVVDTDGGGVNGTGSATLTISSGTVSETLSRVLNVSLPSTINVTTTPLTLTLVSNVAFPQNYTSNDGRGAQSISGSTSFTVVIPSNQHSVSFTIQTASDGNVGNNVFTLSGSPLANYVFLSGTLTVVDTDGGGLNGTGSTTLTISSGTVSETLSTVLNVSLPSTINVTTTPLTLTLVSNVAFPQNYTSNDGRGAQSISGSTSFTVVIPSNQHSVSFTIQTASDGNVGNNVFTLSGSPLSNYTFTSGTLTVVDTDGGGVNGTGSTTLTISSGTVSETLSRVLNLSLPSTINVTTTPLTLTLVSNVAFPRNYTSNDGRGAQSISGSTSFTVVIPSNQHSVSFTIQTASDGNVGNNVFTLSGSPLSNYVFVSGTLTVVDTDGGGVNGTGSTTLTISSGTVSETLSTVLNLSLPSTINVTNTPLTLTLVSNVVFPQNYTSNDGRGAQSISGSTSFTVVIPSNQHSVSFTIQTASDGNVGNNVFVLSGSPLSNYTFITGTLTVIDTDGGGFNGTGSTTLTISSGTVSETLSTVLNISLPSTINVTNTPLTLTLVSNVVFPRNYTSNDGRGAQSISGSTSFTVVIPSNQHSVSFTIQTASDGNVGNNIFVLSGSPLSNYVFVSGTLTVVDTDGGGLNGTGSTTLTINSGTVSETLSKVLNVSLPSTINVTTTPLTLTLVSNVVFPQNYTSNDGRGAQSISGSTSFTVVIPSNQHSVSFTIQTASDGNVGNNVFTLSGSPLSNYVFVSGTLTVVDTDAGGVNGTGSTTLTISSGTVSETLSTVLNVSLPSTINVTTTPLTLTLVSNVAFPRNYTSNDGRGAQSISGSTSFTVVIPSNQHSVSFTIQTASDGNVGNNIFVLSGSPLAHYVFLSGTLTVVDTDGGGLNGTGSTTLTISSGTVSETLSTILNVSLPSTINVINTPLTLTLVSNVAFPRNYTSNDGRGAQSISGSTSFTVVIPSGQHSVSFTIQTASDGNVGNNIFVLSGSPLSNYVFVSGTLTVVDTDGGGVNGTGSTTLTISSGTVSETLSRVLNLSLPSTINVTTTPLTLTLVSNVVFPQNYTSNDGRGAQSISGSTSFTVVIPSNQHSVSFTIQTASDGNVGNNVFVLSGSPLSNYTFITGTLTVVDTDGGGVNGTGSTTLTISSGTVSETLSTVLNISLPSTINVTNTPLTLTLVSNVVFPRNYTSNDGRGAQSISGSTSFTVVIPSGQHSVSFTIQTASDGNVGNNIFVLSGSPLANYTFITGTLTVVDTDGGGVNGTGSTTLTISSGTVSETLSTVLNVSLPSTINVTTTPLTLTLVSNVAFPRNYTSNDGRGAQSISGSTSFIVVLPAGQHSVSFTIQTASDGNVGNNVFVLSGSPLANYVFLSGTLTVVDTDSGGLNGTGSTTLTISSGTVSETLSKVLNVSLPSTINVTTTPLTLTLVSNVAFPRNYTSNDGRGAQSISGSTSFTVVVPAGQHSVSFTIQTASDTNVPDNIFDLSGAFLPNYVFVTGTLRVINTDGRRTPVLTITSPSGTYVGGSFTASVSSTAILSSGGTVTYNIFGTGSGSATINSVTGFITGYRAGQVVLRATSTGDTNYNSVFASQVLTIGKGTPTLSLSATSSQVNVDGILPITAVSHPALTGGLTSVGVIQYSIISGSATIDSSGLLHAVSVGPVVVQAIQSADLNYNAPIPVTQTFTINPAVQSLTITSVDIMSLLSTITATSRSSATGGRGGAISYSISNVSGQALLSGSNEISASLEGTVILHAFTAGDSNYSGASTAQTITIVSLSLHALSSTVSEGSSGTLILSINPVGMVLPEDVIFSLSGSVASLGHYSLPSTVLLPRNQGSVSIVVGALSDTILFDDELLVVTASNVYLNSVSGTLTITDSTSNDASNRAISIGSGTIFQSETREIIVSLPAGVTTSFPITVSLSVNSASDLSLLSSQPVINPLVVVIPAKSNFGSFSVTASSNSDQPAHILVDGSSVSFTVTQGVITVINRKIDVGLGVSVNHDGLNDCLVIRNIERYPDNRVDIVDRQGVTVYSTRIYDNVDRVFCGISNVDSSVYRLPSGPYYYVVKLIDKTQDPNNTREETFYSHFEIKTPQ